MLADKNIYFQTKIHKKVLILVLLEYARRRNPKNKMQEVENVLILVLLEYARRHKKTTTKHYKP